MRTTKRKINRKKQIRNLTILVILFILVIYLFICGINRGRLWIKGYGFSEQTIILDMPKEWRTEYYELEYSIDIEAWNTIENHHHYIDYEAYSKIKDISKEEVIQYVDAFYDLYDSLENAGFTIDICRNLMNNLSIDDFEIILEKGYEYSDIKEYIEVEGVVLSDMDKYLESDLEPVEAVMTISYPFIDSSNEVDQIYSIDDPSDTLVLVKEGFKISESYIPEDLVEVDILSSDLNPDTRMRKEAAKALEKMAKAASKEGYTLAINSAYRSYEDQQQVYDEYFTLYDPVTASSLVAVPGYSEHQLGLSVDLTCKSVIDGVYGVFGDSPDYDWTIEHAHEYGFILRYPENKTEITGTANEPWHYRYVGVDAATEMYEKGWCLEEYIQHHGFTYTLTPE